MRTPSHFNVQGHHREVRTTTNGGVLRLLAPLEFSEDRCVGRLLAVNANRDHDNARGAGEVHPQITNLHVRDGRHARLLSATGGVVLGLFEHAAFDEETLSLSPGDVIVAFSDGVSEAMNEAGDEFTDQRLLAAIEAHRTKPPQDLLESLLADVRAFCGQATPNDDVTMVIVRYEG